MVSFFVLGGDLLSRFSARRGYSFNLDVSPKLNGARVDLTGWTAELEIRDQSLERIVRVQTTPPPPGSPVDTGHGSIIAEVLPFPLVSPPPETSRFVVSITGDAMNFSDGVYTIEMKAFDPTGRDWEFIPPTPIDVKKSILVI